MYKQRLAAIIIVGVVIGLAGCSNSPVAIVNGVRITQGEFNSRLVQNYGRDTLREMIDRQLIKQMADEAGITVTDEELDKEVEQTKAQFPSPEQFQRWLESRDMNEDEWREALKIAIVARKLALKDVKYDEAELKAFFEQHKDRYALPTRVSISEIVVGTKKEAEEVLAQLKKEPAKFADLARVYSQAPYTRARGGKRPENMPLERVTPEAIRKAAAELAIGQISAPIAGEGQWYIIKIDQRQPARKASWQKDKDRVKRDYEAANAKPLGQLLQDAVKKADVQIVDPRFQALNEIYTPVPEKIPTFGPHGPEGEKGAQKKPAESAPAAEAGKGKPAEQHQPPAGKH